MKSEYKTYPAKASGLRLMSKALISCVDLRASFVSLTSPLNIFTDVDIIGWGLRIELIHSMSSYTVDKLGPQARDISRPDPGLGHSPEFGFWQDWTYWMYVSDWRKLGYVVSLIRCSTSCCAASNTCLSTRPSLTLRFASFRTSSGICSCDLTKNLEGNQH